MPSKLVGSRLFSIFESLQIHIKHYYSDVSEWYNLILIISLLLKVSKIPTVFTVYHRN